MNCELTPTSNQLSLDAVASAYSAHTLTAMVGLLALNQLSWEAAAAPAPHAHSGSGHHRKEGKIRQPTAGK